ncbi:tail protein [Aeromonas phage vB_AceP_PAc]|nr:tail protein [Aeromonas phage vB_AceP_PAc]
MASTYQESIEQTITAGEQIHQIVNGTATTEVTVEDGSKVPSIRKALLDNFYFKDPIAWQVGQTENVFNQLRQFTDGSWWYAPSATASNPISMGSTPIGDSLWKIYDFDAIGKLEPRVDEALRRSYAEAGYNVVGTFQEGFTYVNINDIGIDEVTGKGYTGPAGPVATGTDPTSGGFVDISGELLRKTLVENSIFISAYKTPYATIHDALDAAMALSASTGVTVVADVGFSITRPIEQPPKSKVIWTANCTISPSFSGAHIYQVDGGYSLPSYNAAHAWTLPGKTSMEGFKAYAENFAVGVNAEALVIRRAINTKVHDVVITGANLGGLRSQDGYEAEVQNINVIVSSARDVASIGCAINSSDGAFRSIVPIGYAKGGRVTGGSNYIENLHPWGNTETDAIGVMGKMHWGIEDVAGAEKNTFVSCYSDSPTRINTSADPSRLNGGVGWMIDSWYTTVIGGRHLGHSSNPDQTLIPLIISGQQCEISGFNDLRPSKSKQPVVVFEGTASPVNNNFSGGTVGRYLAGNFGYFTTQSNFLSSVNFKQNPRYGSVDLCFQINNSGVLVPGVGSDVLYVTLPSYINTNTIRGFASVPRLLYTFRKVFQSAGKTPVDVIAEIIPSTNRIQFVITYSDGTSSGYVTAAGLTAGDSGIFASFNIVGIANDNM